MSAWGDDRQDISFDHAAPFFTARTGRFRDGALKEWMQAGVAALWPDAAAAGPSEPRYVGQPFSNSIARWIVTTLEEDGQNAMRFGEHVNNASFSPEEGDTGKWVIRSTNRGSQASSSTAVDVPKSGLRKAFKGLGSRVSDSNL